MHSAQTLDAKIGALTAAVGDLQGEVQAALATLRAAGNVAGSLSYLSRVTLLLMRRLFGAAGQQAPSDNLNAMQWCREAQRHEWQGRLALAIGRFLLRCGSLDEALRSLEWGLEAAPQVPEEATRLYAQLLLEGAGLHLDTHEWAAARARALDALALFETSGDIVGQADTQNLLGLAARGARDYPEASRYFAQAYTAYERAAGQTGETGVANALNNLGITEDEAGCKQKATAHLQAALALRRRQGDMRGTAETLNNLGALAKDQNQLEEARQFYAEALQFEQALRYDIGVARALFNLGEVDALQGDYGSARRLTAAAACLFDKVGSPHRQDATQLLQAIGGDLDGPPGESLRDKDLNALVAWALREPSNG